MINKLLLVRQTDIDSSLTERAGVGAFLKGKPLPVSPLTWREEDGLSHYGFVLEGMKLADLKELEDWIKRNGSEGVTLHEHEGDVAATLAGVGLRVNDAA